MTHRYSETVFSHLKSLLQHFTVHLCYITSKTVKVSVYLNNDRVRKMKHSKMQSVRENSIQRDQNKLNKYTVSIASYDLDIWTLVYENWNLSCSSPNF